MTDLHSGACPCGAITVEVLGPPVDIAACPCSSCRASARSAFVALALWPEGAVLVTRGADRLAGPTARQCCLGCGAHVLSRHRGLVAIGAALAPDLAPDLVVPAVQSGLAEPLPVGHPRPRRRRAA